jgi:hypothetical protein
MACNDGNQKQTITTDSRLTSWKTGRFYYMDETFGKFEIERTDSFQIERIVNNGMEVSFRINWMNDSMYTLAYKGISKNPQHINLPSDIDSLVKTCTITELTDTSYNEKATSNLNESVNYTLMLME